jgi:hypothetical protein
MAGAWDNGSVVRIHSHGDFFNIHYLRAWQSIAYGSPSNYYYCYTKAVRWAVRTKEQGFINDNFSMTMSRGGTEDRYIAGSGIKEAIVVGSEEEANALGLEVDHDDSHACFGRESFALLLHGTQPPGTKERWIPVSSMGVTSHARSVSTVVPTITSGGDTVTRLSSSAHRRTHHSSTGSCALLTRTTPVDAGCGLEPRRPRGTDTSATSTALLSLIAGRTSTTLGQSLMGWRSTTSVVTERASILPILR